MIYLVIFRKERDNLTFGGMREIMRKSICYRLLSLNRLYVEKREI